MERIRKFHNSIKLSHIQKYTRNGENVLDVGCGRGGDMFKWIPITNNVLMCDPDIELLKIAKERARKSNVKCIRFIEGDIAACPKKKFDIICYNFSIQYCFENFGKFTRTLKEILFRTKVGSRVFGCIPDSDYIQYKGSFQDNLGNVVACKDVYGNLGDTIKVMLVDTPYYNGSFISEPIAYKDLFITWMEKNGFMMLEWTPFTDSETHTISDMYSRFCFLRIQ